MNDDELLERLRFVLLPDPGAVPSPESIVALRQVVHQPKAAPSSRRLVAAVALVVSSLAVTTTAFALSGQPLPRVIREVVSAARLPVDSPALADARDHRRQLRDALDAGDTAAIARAAVLVRADLASLDADDRSQIEPEADALLARADQHQAPQSETGPDQQAPPAHVAPPAAGQDGSQGSQSNASEGSQKDQQAPDARTDTITGDESDSSTAPAESTGATQSDADCSCDHG